MRTQKSVSEWVMCDSSMTAVRCVAEVTDGFQMAMGLHQGAAMSLFWLALATDGLTDEVRQDCK